MKAVNNIFLALILVMANLNFAYAGEDLPEPDANAKKSGSTMVTNNVQEPVPIDQNLSYLMVAGLTLGVALIYSRYIKKASI